jgi:hypothetical protein
MKNLNSILFIAILVSVHHVFAQSISINHQFQGTSFSNISKGNNKVGFVSYDTIAGAPYLINYMDSLQNMVSTIDTNITYPSYNPYAGDVLLVTEMDPNGHLWGLFFDRTYYLIQNPGTSQPSIFTYFLYDFDNHQKHYLDVQPFIETPFNYGPVEESLHNINFLNDTIYITIGMMEFTTGQDPREIIIQWSNGNQVSIGTNGAMASEVIIGYNNKLTHIFSGDNIFQTLGNDINNNPVGYNQNLPVNDPILQVMSSESYDGYTHNGNTYVIGFAYDFIGSNPSFNYLIIKNDIFDTVINIPTSGLNDNFSTVVVDHANRIWVYDGGVSLTDSLFMYDGTGWHSFSLPGLSLLNNNFPAYYPWEFNIVEYAHNRFMMNANKNRFPVTAVEEIGNGILFFDYNEVATKIENKVVENIVKVAPNPAQGFIYLLGKNNQIQTATIYDAVGKVVLRSIVNSNQSIDVNGLSKGIYFVEAAGQRVKFVKE